MHTVELTAACCLPRFAQVRVGGSSTGSSSTGSSSTGSSSSIASSSSSSNAASAIGAPGSDVPVSELAALAASGATLNRKQRRALERHAAAATPTSSAPKTSPAPAAAAAPPAAAAPAVPASRAAGDDAGTLAELQALQASGTTLNRKQRRAFERLSKASA